MSVGRTGGLADRRTEIGNLDGWITRGDRRWKIGTGQETSNQNRLREPSPCRIAKTIITGSSNKNMNLIFCYINATSGPRRSPAPTCVEFIMCGPTDLWSVVRRVTTLECRFFCSGEKKCADSSTEDRERERDFHPVFAPIPILSYYNYQLKCVC